MFEARVRSLAVADTEKHASQPLDARASTPQQVPQAVAAKHERRKIAAEAGVLVLADDTALSIAPTNSVEEMLAHQMAACHNAAVRLIARASTVGKVDLAIKLTNASARMMEVFQQAALTLHRLRTGGRQVVTVQHVTVGEGGQAVVAGTIEPRAKC